MGERIEGFAAQLRAGASIAEPMLAGLAPHGAPRVLLFGMGGSAIAGDMVRALVDREGASPFHVVRHYEPPAWITPEDLLIFSSLLGETEETLTAFPPRYLGARLDRAFDGRHPGPPGGRGSDPGRHHLGDTLQAALGFSFRPSSRSPHTGLLPEGPARLEVAAQAVEGNFRFAVEL